MPTLPPKNNPYLFGHEQAEAQLLNDFSSGKLAHGWIISGPEGIGKATLAHRFARTLLSGLKPGDITPDHPVFQRISAGSHSDFLRLEPLFDSKKDEFVRDITVEQAREIPQFLSMTPGEGAWRVVIIDSVDALNSNGANAILKILEEPPPQAVLMLISHNPGRLLPTIRSRCRQLPLKALTEHQFNQVIEVSAPDMPAADVATLGQLTNYSPGLASTLYEQGAIAMYHKIIDIFLSLPSLDIAKAHAFADAIGYNHGNWRLFARLTLCLLNRIVLEASGLAVEAVSANETKLLDAMARLHPPELWAAKWQEAADQFLLAQRLHLDYKQCVLVFLDSLPSKQEFHIGNAAA